MKIYYAILIILNICISQYSFGQIKIVNTPKINKNLKIKQISDEKLIETIKLVIIENEKARSTSIELMTDEEKKKIKTINKPLIEIVKIDAKEYLSSKGEETSIDLEIVFDQTRDKLGSVIDALRMAKLIVKL